VQRQVGNLNSDQGRRNKVRHSFATRQGDFSDSIRKSIFNANVDADRRHFGRNSRNESLEPALRFQLGYRFGSGLRKQNRPPTEAALLLAFDLRAFDRDRAHDVFSGQFSKFYLRVSVGHGASVSLALLGLIPQIDRTLGHWVALG
jgi:hypothetical protein